MTWTRTDHIRSQSAYVSDHLDPSSFCRRKKEYILFAVPVSIHTKNPLTLQNHLLMQPNYQFAIGVISNFVAC
jgi:hypothetical protein